MTSTTRKSILVSLILAAAISIGMHQQKEINAAQRVLEETRAQIIEKTNNVLNAVTELESLQETLRTRRSMREHTAASVAQVQRELATKNPESQWAELPANLPDWNSESPYVWVRKEVVKDISAEVFQPDGALDIQVGAVLAIDPLQAKSVNAKLARILREYRELEAATVKFTDEHLPGAHKDGKTVTITWDRPKESHAFRQNFERTLREGIGAQRANLLLEVDYARIQTMFGPANNFFPENKITLSRHTNSGYNISVRNGGSWFSAGMPKGYDENLSRYIPPHLMPFFTELLNEDK